LTEALDKSVYGVFKRKTNTERSRQKSKYMYGEYYGPRLRFATRV